MKYILHPEPNKATINTLEFSWEKFYIYINMAKPKANVFPLIVR